VDLCHNSPIPPNPNQPLKPKIGMGENLSFAFQIVIQFKISTMAMEFKFMKSHCPKGSIHGINNFFNCCRYVSQMPLIQGKNYFLLKKNANFVATSFTITWGIAREATHSTMGCEAYNLKEHICWVETPTFLEESGGS
jgi:hypothetical protein